MAIRNVAPPNDSALRAADARRQADDRKQDASRLPAGLEAKAGKQAQRVARLRQFIGCAYVEALPGAKADQRQNFVAAGN